jgi:hypothetical protein
LRSDVQHEHYGMLVIDLGIVEVMFPILSYLFIFMMNQSFKNVGVIQVVVARKGAADENTVERNPDRSRSRGAEER